MQIRWEEQILLAAVGGVEGYYSLVAHVLLESLTCT